MPASCSVDLSPLSTDDLHVHSAGCMQGMVAVFSVTTESVVNLYDLSLEKALVELRIWDGKLALALAGDELKVSGAGCDAVLHLE